MLQSHDLNLITGVDYNEAKSSFKLRAASKISGAVLEGAKNVFNVKSAAGLGGGLLAAAALSNLDNDYVVAGTAGAVGNLSSDTASAVVGRATTSGIGSVTRNVSASTLASRAARSLARGGAGGILGLGVEMAVADLGRTLHINRAATHVGSSVAGGAAAGALKHRRHGAGA